MIAIGSSFKNRFNSPKIFICGLLSRDECFSINRVITDEINDFLSFKCSVNNLRFIGQSNRWTLNNSTLDFSLFYSDGLHLIEKCNLELGKSILKVIDSSINGSKIPNRYKNTVCSTDFNSILEDFTTFPSIVPVRNSVSFSKSIIKVVSTSSVRPGKLICGRNVPPSKHVSLALFIQVNPLVIKMSFRLKLSMLVLLVQVNQFVVVMLV